MSFVSKWDKETKEEESKISGPIKPRIELAQKRLQMQINALDSILQRLKSKDEMIFKRIINALQKRDTQYSIILSNELAQIRKTIKMVNRSKLALEQVNLRLNTITELGDVVVTLSPAMAVVKNVRAGLSDMMPEVDNSMNDISNVLANILIDAGQVGGYTINFDTANEEAAKIMEEAAAIAENSIEERLPDVTMINEKKIVSNE
ncbi:MAG: Snf7 family protein [Candidatus Nitrosocaldaceae archaeon]